MAGQARELPLLGDQDDPTVETEQTPAPTRSWLHRCCVCRCTVDLLVLVLCVLCLGSSIGLGVILALNKHQCDGNCMLTAHYTPWAGIDYDNKTVWTCDALLFFTLFPATIAFIFMMVNWVAQLKSSVRWIKIEIGLVIFTVAGYCIFVPFLFVGMAIWCEHMKTDLLDNFERPADLPKYPDSCVDTAIYLDTYRLHRTESLTAVHRLIIAAMGVGISCVFFHSILLGCLAYKLYAVLVARKEKEFQMVLNAPVEEERRKKLRKLPPIMGKHQKLMMERAKAQAGQIQAGPEQAGHGQAVGNVREEEREGACGNSSDI